MLSFVCLLITENFTSLQYGEEQLLHFLVKEVVILPSIDKPKLACCPKKRKELDKLEDLGYRFKASARERINGFVFSEMCKRVVSPFAVITIQMVYRRLEDFPVIQFVNYITRGRTQTSSYFVFDLHIMRKTDLTIVINSLDY